MDAQPAAPSPAGSDEPTTPLWFTLLGLALFLASGLYLAASLEPEKAPAPAAEGAATAAPPEAPSPPAAH